MKHVEDNSVTYIMLMNKVLCIKVGKWNVYTNTHGRKISNFYLSYNLHKSIYYRPFSWRYYPKWHFSTQNGLLL